MEYFKHNALEKFNKTLNNLGSKQVPFLFFIDYEMQKPVVFRLNEINSTKLLYDFNGISNLKVMQNHLDIKYLKKNPVSKKKYQEAYEIVSKALLKGNTYLANLTFRTQIETNLTLHELFFISFSRYKLWYNNKFLCFSPETFISIKEGTIRTCPMKGTIDASISDAMNKILNNTKEKAEHDTVVDLLRNDLSKIASNVGVNRYRYIEKIHTANIDLLQVSSEITGNLNNDYFSIIGDIICSLLPAGSVSGAPKNSTVSILQTAEKIPRGYYTGICGIFDGKNLDSGVMIRFIENCEGILYYRSGGGITSMSNMDDEYNEMIDKVYVPVY